MDMKKVVMILLAVMIFSFALAGILGAGMGTWTIGTSDIEPVDKTLSFTAENTEEIIIDAISTDITIIPTEEEQINVHLHGHADTELIPADFARQSGNRIAIDIRPVQQPTINFGTSLRLALDVYVPTDYAKTLRVNSVSGDLVASDLSLATLSFKSVSGKLRATNFAADNANLSTTSGNLEISGFAGDLITKTVSGDVSIEYVEFNNNVTASTTSGDTMIKLPEDAQFSVQLETVSGEVKSDFSITVDSLTGNRRFAGTVGNAEQRIQVKSVSGDLHLRK